MNNLKIKRLAYLALGFACVCWLLCGIRMREKKANSQRILNGDMGEENANPQRILSDYEIRTLELLRRGAEEGQVDYQYKLARLLSGYSEINHVNEDKVIDYAEAFKWFEKAAQQGDRQAQYHLGVCYLTGRGISRNVFQAEKWFFMAKR